MGKQLLIERIRESIGSIGFKIFLWSIKMSADEYFDMILRSHIADEYP